MLQKHNETNPVRWSLVVACNDHVTIYKPWPYPYAQQHADHDAHDLNGTVMSAPHVYILHHL